MRVPPPQRLAERIPTVSIGEGSLAFHPLLFLRPVELDAPLRRLE